MVADDGRKGFDFHHVGIAVRDLAATLTEYTELFGYELRSGPFDDPIQRVSVCFMSRGNGDPTLELVGALGPDSPIGHYLRRGGGPYHVCYEVPDLDAAIAGLLDKGALLISEPVPATAFGMRKIAWLMTATEQLIELLQAR